MRYTDEQVECVLQLYRQIFSNRGAGWRQVAEYWDFGRSRQWSWLTTDFHAVTAGQILTFDAARRNWCRSNRPENDAEALVNLAREHKCGYSLGISPWTDSALQATFTPETTKLIVLVGHDWYPIVPLRGPVEARPPLDSFRLLDSADDVVRAYARGMPSAEDFHRAGIGLLFLNLVPDFRPPNAKSDGTFPFTDRTFHYDHCAAGIKEALRLAQARFRILRVVTWGNSAWEAFRYGVGDHDSAWLGVKAASAQYGQAGVPWQIDTDQETFSIHPFPHPLPSKQHLNWTSELFAAYSEMWKGCLSSA